MLQAEYKRDMNQNYLVVQVEGELDTQAYQTKMLLSGVVPHLLSCHLQSVDGLSYLHYAVTSRQSIEKVQEGRLLNYDDLLLLFGGFIHAMEAMSEYLMSASNLVIEPSMIFVDPEQKDLYFCYVPGYEKEIRDQFQKLTEYVLPKLDHKDSRAVMLGYGVYRRALEDSFHLEHVKEELYRYREPLPESVGAYPPGQGQRKEPEMGYQDRPRGGWYGQRQAFTPKNRQAPSETPGRGTNLSRQIPPDPPRREASPWEDEEEGEGLGVKKIAILSAVAVALVLVVAAKLLGYLPGISLETLLAGATLCIAILVLLMHLPGRKKKEGISGQGTAFVKEPSFVEEREKPFGGEREKKKKQNARIRLEPEEELSGGSSQVFPSSDTPFSSQEPQISSGRRIPLFQGQEGFPGEEEEGYGETVALSSLTKARTPSLVSREAGELPTIYLTQELTVIGKMENAADVVLDFPTVSRVHARIRRRDGSYFLSDLNSRNGTSVNGHMLGAEEEWELQDQDEVDFAQARFVFLK